ncbi:MAG: POTRA domain-containing protein [Planctomycetota bacterium]
MDPAILNEDASYRRQVKRRYYLATLALLSTVVLTPEYTWGQSGARDPIQPVLPKERAPDIGASARNVNRDAANLIADVIFKGNQVVPEHELNRNIGTRPGRYFDPDLLQQDVNKLWRMPEIKRINGPYIDKTDKGMVITIDIVERKHIRSIRFLGNRGLTDRALKKETDLDINQPLDLHKIKMAKTRIEEFYREKGYPNTQVEILNIEEVENGDIQFLIHEDQKQRIWKVDFVGNTFVSDARLRNFVNSKPGILKVFGGVAQQQELQQDILRLESYYKSFGFFNARIGRETETDKQGRWLTIRYIIDEGPRYKIRNVAFVGNDVFTSEQLNSMVELKPLDGESPEFNVSKMNRDVVSLRDLYGSHGFVYSSVEAEPRFLEEPGTLDIVYRIKEGKQYRVGRINLHFQGGFSATKREVALNRLSLKPGDPINSRELRNSERRLNASQIFAGQNAGPGRAPARIVVKPKELQDLERTARNPEMGGSSQGSGSRYR